MSNILNHNRLPLECKLSGKDYWDFCLRIGREYYAFTKGMQTKCLSSYIDTEFDECIMPDGTLVGLGEYEYEHAVSNTVTLKDIGLTGMDNGFISFDKETVTDEEFDILLHKSIEYPIPYNGDLKNLRVRPISGNNDLYTYEVGIEEYDCVRASKLNGGFYQGVFRIGNGCEYSILPSDIGEGLSMEFVLCRKDFQHEGTTLNDASDNANKGIFFYIGTRAENKWVRFYGDSCSDTELEKSSVETSDGVKVDEYIQKLVESDNKYLMYSRACDGKTALDDDKDETALVDTSSVEYDDNLFTVFSRKCGGITVKNFEDDYLKKHPAKKYNVYSDLWNNALAFRITEDNRVGYKYLVKDCEQENASCGYKIESEYSYADTVPFQDWTTIHVRILPVGEIGMRLMFYVDGRLVLYSKVLPKLNLRELNDISEKQEMVPFNISIGGGTQGLADVVYDDYKEFFETNYPLQKEFAGSFIGYLKSFRFYSCSLNYSQLGQNVYKNTNCVKKEKIYGGAIVFNTKPSRTPIGEQREIIRFLNEYNTDVESFDIRLLPDISKKYLRLVVAIPSNSGKRLDGVFDWMNGLETTDIETKCDITPLFTSEQIQIDEVMYDVYYYTYSTPPQYNNVISIKII